MGIIREKTGTNPMPFGQGCIPDASPGFYDALGPFLLLAARKPSSHRSLIAFAAWSSLTHASVMTIQTVEAWNHGIHRDFTDGVLFGVIGGVLLALSPAKQEAAATVVR